VLAYRVLAACLCAAAVHAAEVLPTAKPEAVGLSANELGRIVPAVEKLVADGRIAGAVTAVARRGKIVHFEATGLMDIESGRPMRRDTIFRIYSMTKPVAVVAALILCDEGELDLDAPVAKYLPQFEDLVVLAGEERVAPSRPMTVRDLMRHTSGLTYGLLGNTPVDRVYRKAKILDDGGDLAAMVEKLSKIPLLFHPGERWNYGVSIDVLGRVVEVVSGRPFDVFLKVRIFDPLGMVDTGFHVPEEKLSRFATNYSRRREGLRVFDHPKRSRFARAATFFSGGAGLVSTASDYLRFAQMLLNGGVLGDQRILKASTVVAMTTNQLDKKLIPIRFGGFPLPGTGFGLGVSVRVAPSAFPYPGAVGEWGWAGAASTSFWVRPDEELIGIVLTQHMPFTVVPVMAVRPLVDGAIVDGAAATRERAGIGK
jgi:CubicO group peptidase (beta-lactamase class C family)